MSQYLDQLARVRRFLRRIETHNRPAVDYDDDIWLFYQNCWHLKDWIKNDTTVPITVRRTLEDKLKQCPELMICADLANATKHLELKTPRVGAKHHHKNYRVVVGGPRSIEYFIDRGDGTRIDGLALARECVRQWEALLKHWELPSDV